MRRPYRRGRHAESICGSPCQHQGKADLPANFGCGATVGRESAVNMPTIVNHL